MNIIPISQLNLCSIIVSLHEGKTIVYPTETCYGLGCDATNAQAVGQIYKIKQRPEKKSLLVIASDVGIMKQYVEWNSILDNIAQKYWPGPLTVIVPIKQGICLPQGIVSEEGAIAFRITSHPIAQELCRALCSPLVSTSANISGGNNVYTSSDVIKTFEHRLTAPDMFIDVGDLFIQKPSTIIALKDGKIEIVRQGNIVVESYPVSRRDPAPAG